jgi:hypothetical protein
MTKAMPAAALDIEGLKPMASESLDIFATVAADARGRIESRSGRVPDVLTTTNILNALQGLV